MTTGCLSGQLQYTRRVLAVACFEVQICIEKALCITARVITRRPAVARN